MFYFRKITILLSLILIITLPDSLQAAQEKPNIVYIMVDDMGYGDAGCYNPKSKTPTPNIDSLANAGMRFTDAHSPGALCHPSRYGLLTGQHPFRTDVSLWRKQPVIREGQITIASLLQSNGYRTAMVGKWHLGFQENNHSIVVDLDHNANGLAAGRPGETEHRLHHGR